MDAHTREHLHESPWVVTLPLILLAIPSVVDRLVHDRAAAVRRFLRRRDPRGGRARRAGARWRGVPRPGAFVLHGLMGPAVWLAVAGGSAAWFLYLRRPELAGRGCASRRAALHAARQQVLLRCLQRESAGRRQPHARHGVVEGRGRRADRRRRRQRLGTARGLGRRRRPRDCRPATSTTTRSRRSSALSGLLAWLLWRT